MFVRLSVRRVVRRRSGAPSDVCGAGEYACVGRRRRGAYVGLAGRVVGIESKDRIEQGGVDQ